jgi:acyl dehydratase
MSEAKQLYLDDLHVGERFTSESYLLEAARIQEFAAEFDPQPFHLDQVAAEASVLGGLAASGWHTAAVAMRLLVAGIRQWHYRLGRRNRLAQAHETRR